MKQIIQTTNYFNDFEPPTIILCNPNKEELEAISSIIYNTKLNLVYNGLSEFTFTIPQSIDGGDTTLDAYSLIKSKRLIYLKDMGYFIITSVEEDDDGSVPISHVTCNSLEAELNGKRITAYEGTVKFYEDGDEDLAVPVTVLGKVLKLCPAWSSGTISTSLAIKYRTFSTSDSTVYAFLMNDVSKAFDCVFEFDTINKTISASLVSEIIAQSGTDIFISHDNLIKDSKFTEYSDEIATALYCYGGGDLTIRNVNPLGTNALYDFSYYMTTDWMSQSLIDAITAWEDRIEDYTNIGTYTVPYSTLVEGLLTAYQNLAVQETALANRTIDYEAQNVILKTGIEANDSLVSDYNSILKMLNDADSVNETAVLARIEAIDLGDPDFFGWLGGDFTLWKNDDWLVYKGIVQINEEIATIQGSIDVLLASIENINDILSFENNFTASQLLDLQAFIFENTWQNENIITTDQFTSAEIQEASQELYDQGEVILAKVSQPRYEFSMETADIIALPEFDRFADELELGKSVTIYAHNALVYPILLGIEMSFDNLEDFSMTFSNRLRLDGGDYQFSDLFGETVKTGGTVSFGKLKWDNFDANYKNDVSAFINDALDASRNAVVNASNQEILINQAGLQGRRDDGSGGYEDEQVWLTSNVLVFTKDSWNTASTALGKLPNGSYGLVAETIVGNIIAGNELNITNEAGSFVVDADRATFTDLSINAISSDNRKKLIIDPVSSNILRIQKNEAGTWDDVLRTDVDGNIEVTGKITANSGKIGTLSINSSGLYDGYGNYIRSGNVKLGGLTISGTTATFNGRLIVNEIIGKISYNNITDIPPSQISSGTMSGVGLRNIDGYSNAISTSGGGLSISSYNNILLNITRGWGGLELGLNYTGLQGNLWIDGYQGDSLYNLRVWDYNGMSYRTLSFYNGIYIG